MREASQRRRAKGGSAYAEGMEPASESCMNSLIDPVVREEIQRTSALTV